MKVTGKLKRPAPMRNFLMFIATANYSCKLNAQRQAELGAACPGSLRAAPSSPSRPCTELFSIFVLDFNYFTLIIFKGGNMDYDHNPGGNHPYTQMSVP